MSQLISESFRHEFIISTFLPTPRFGFAPKTLDLCRYSRSQCYLNHSDQLIPSPSCLGMTNFRLVVIANDSSWSRPTNYLINLMIFVLLFIFSLFAVFRLRKYHNWLEWKAIADWDDGESEVEFNIFPRGERKAREGVRFAFQQVSGRRGEETRCKY